MKKGSKVQLKRVVDYSPYAMVLSGETGVVMETVDTYGQRCVNIQLDTEHPGLAGWANCVLLAGDDLESVAVQQWRSSGCVSRIASTLLLVLTLAAGAELAAASVLHIPSTVATLFMDCLDFDCSN